MVERFIHKATGEALERQSSAVMGNKTDGGEGMKELPCKLNYVDMQRAKTFLSPLKLLHKSQSTCSKCWKTKWNQWEISMNFSIKGHTLGDKAQHKVATILGEISRASFTWNDLGEIQNCQILWANGLKIWVWSNKADWWDSQHIQNVAISLNSIFKCSWCYRAQSINPHFFP